jgi:hypothetical protein
MPNRDSWASALAPRLSPKTRSLHFSRTQAAGVSAATHNITLALSAQVPGRVGSGRPGGPAGGLAFFVKPPGRVSYF